MKLKRTMKSLAEGAVIFAAVILFACALSLIRKPDGSGIPFTLFICLGAMLVGIVLIVPNSASSVEIENTGLVIKYPFGKKRTLSWHDISEARLIHAQIGKAGPDGQRTRCINLSTSDGFSLVITDAEFTHVVSYLIDSLTKYTGERFLDQR